MMTDSPQEPPAQTLPVPTGTEARVCQDIAKRQQMGIRKYGTTLAENPLTLLQFLRHAYEESLDLPIYLRRAIDELESQLHMSST